MLIFEEKIPNNRTEFKSKVRQVSDNLDIDPNWLMAVMNFESNLNPKAVNPYTGATGLIQFMPSTARGLGTTVRDLRNMDNVMQLDYVEKYYKPYKSRLLNYEDLYLATFFPKAMNKPLDYILETDTISAAKIASQNPVFDANKDKEITVKEIKEMLMKKIPSSWHNVFFKTMDSANKFAIRNKWRIGGVLAATALTIFIIKKF